MKDKRQKMSMFWPLALAQNPQMLTSAYFMQGLPLPYPPPPPAYPHLPPPYSHLPLGHGSPPHMLPPFSHPPRHHPVNFMTSKLPLFNMASPYSHAPVHARTGSERDVNNSDFLLRSASPSLAQDPLTMMQNMSPNRFWMTSPSQHQQTPVTHLLHSKTPPATISDVKKESTSALEATGSDKKRDVIVKKASELFRAFDNSR